jgi:hypothetical protein
MNMNCKRQTCFLAAVLTCTTALAHGSEQGFSDPSFVEVRAVSSLDGTEHATTGLKPETLHYTRELENCIGGLPGTSDAVKYELTMRSPVRHLAKAADVPLDINTGIHDGHIGSVPVSQSKRLM